MPLYLNRPAHEELLAIVEVRLPNESGGLLIGFRAGKNICIEHIVEVDGPRGPAHYVLREAEREKALDGWRRRHPSNTLSGYVGTWHSHPGPAGPSRRDWLTFGYRSARTKDPIGMIVATRLGHDQWKLIGMELRRRLPAQCDVVVV